MLCVVASWSRFEAWFRRAAGARRFECGIVDERTLLAGSVAAAVAAGLKLLDPALSRQARECAEAILVVASVHVFLWVTVAVLEFLGKNTRGCRP